jgi:transposase
MKNYPDEFKASIIARLLPPNNAYVPELAKETGVPQDTLYMWRLKARGHRAKPVSNKPPMAGLSSEDKFNIVIETASLNEEELSVYCRRKGLYPDQIRNWKKLCLKANESSERKVDREKLRQQEKENKQLKTELRRKEKALAETAALLVLKKKVQEIWGDPEDD